MSTRISTRRHTVWRTPAVGPADRTRPHNCKCGRLANAFKTATLSTTASSQWTRAERPTLTRAAEADEQQRERLSCLHLANNPGLDPSRVTIGSARPVHLICNACPCGHPHEWQTSVQEFFLEGTGCPICSGRKPCRCNSLSALHPTLCQQWDYDKNKQAPSDFLPMSRHQAWWVCREHEPPHSWQAAMHSRSRSGKLSARGCPKCGSERRQRFGKQPSVAAAGPPLEHLAEQWHPDNDRQPDAVTLGSSYKAIWTCPNSTCQHPHVWTAQVNARARDMTSCPFCAGRRVCPCNSLQALAPDLAAQWDHAANAAIGTPEHFSPGSAKRAAWQHAAADGSVHRWKAYIFARHAHQSGCPICRGRRPSHE